MRSLSTQRNFIAALAAGFLLFGCGNKTDGDDATNADIVRGVNGAIGEALAGNSRDAAADAAARGACGGVSFGTCSNGVRLRDLSPSAADTGGCTRGTLTVFGQILRTFSAAPACTFAPTQTVTRTTRNHYYTEASGAKVLTYTGAETVAGKVFGATDLVAYNGTSYSGGSVLTKTAANNFSLEIKGIHHRRLRANGSFGFWHTVYTTAPVVTSLAGSTFTVASGSVALTHNILKYTATTTTTGLTYGSACCYPTAGTQTVALTGSRTETLTIDWTPGGTTCGDVKINNISTSLPSCEPGT